MFELQQFQKSYLPRNWRNLTHDDLNDFIRLWFILLNNSRNVFHLHILQFQIHTHTVCVPYYKAAPYNISHTKIFLMAIFTLIFFYKFFFMYVYHA